MSTLTLRRDDARLTLGKLLITHRHTIFDIEFDGKRFFKDGVDITRTVRARCLFEIQQCLTVLDALDHMRDGDIQKAAELCSRIQERIGER